MFGMDINVVEYFLVLLLCLALSLFLFARFLKCMRQRDEAISMAEQLRAEITVLGHQAFHDHLTGLPNRALLEDRICQSLVHARREGSSFLILFLDLDRFKPVNDKYGHEIGDRLLIKVGKRICDTVRQGDTVARIGGDEFVILALISCPADAPLIVKKVKDCLTQTFVVSGHSLQIGASIGQSIFPDDGYSLEELLWKADEAMYNIKKLGRDSISADVTQLRETVNS